MSVFADDWRDTLKEQYKHVIREDDNHTEATLRTIMYDVGFDDDDLAQLKIEATMRADDLTDAQQEEIAQRIQPGVDIPIPAETPAEEREPDPVMELPQPEAEPAAEATEAEANATPEEAIDEPEQPDDDDPNGPTQMSMF